MDRRRRYYDYYPRHDCTICSRWSPALRPSMRSEIDRLPLEMDEVDQVCDQCLMAFWANCARSKTKRA
jgi:hypothetical protein